MDTKRIAGFAMGIGFWIVLGGMVFLSLDGWAWLSGTKTAQKPVPDPLGKLAEYRACADGTVYMITNEDGKVFWLVGAKATAVECPETIDAGYGCHGDVKGGLYVQGKEHLWYLCEGAAAQVKEVPRNEIPEGEHLVTPMSVIWSAGQETYEVRD